MLGEIIGNRTCIDNTPIEFKKYRSYCYLMECNNCKERQLMPLYEIYAEKACGSCFKKHKASMGKYMSNVIYRSKQKKWFYDIDEEYILKLFEKQKGLCSLSNVPLTLRKTSNDYSFTASLDRIDSSKGYIKGNVQWVHKWINKMKLDLPQERFLEFCNLVTRKNLFFGTRITAFLKIEGIHRWKECSLDEVSYLKDYHRHIFHIRVYKWVNHNDRDTEFIKLSHDIRTYLNNRYYLDSFKCLQLGDRSCEMIAQELLDVFDLQSVEVLEDGEGGALVNKL